MERRDGTALIGKLHTPHFAPAALSSEGSQLVNDDYLMRQFPQVYNVLNHDHHHSKLSLKDSKDGSRVDRGQVWPDRGWQTDRQLLLYINLTSHRGRNNHFCATPPPIFLHIIHSSVNLNLSES